MKDRSAEIIGNVKILAHIFFFCMYSECVCECEHRCVCCLCVLSLGVDIGCFSQSSPSLIFGNMFSLNVELSD